jgi:hypothetical protein
MDAIQREPIADNDAGSVRNTSLEQMAAHISASKFVVL